MDIEQIINLLPDYNDLGWDKRLDDLKCDVHFAKEQLILLAANANQKEKCEQCTKHADKLNKISAVVNGALLTTTKRLNSGPEVFVGGSRFVEAKNLEDVLGHIAELLVAKNNGQ